MWVHVPPLLPEIHAAAGNCSAVAQLLRYRARTHACIPRLQLLRRCQPPSTPLFRMPLHSLPRRNIRTLMQLPCRQRFSAPTQPHPDVLPAPAASCLAALAVLQALRLLRAQATCSPART